MNFMWREKGSPLGQRHGDRGRLELAAASFISMAGIIAFAGYGGSVYLMGWTGGYVLLAVLLRRFCGSLASSMVPDFVGDRYESNTVRFWRSWALFVSFTYVAGQMRGVGWSSDDSGSVG